MVGRFVKKLKKKFKSILILSTETIHHKYLINSISKKFLIKCILFEQKKFKASFYYKNPFTKEQNVFEKNFFFKNKKVNIDNNIPQFYCNDINSKFSYNLLKNNKPDFGIVFGTSKINPKIINLFKDGLINIHRGVISKYRGLDSDWWAIYHNDFQNIGVCVHRVSKKLDAGHIFKSSKLKIKKKMKIYQLQAYTTDMATKIIILALKKYFKNRIVFNKQKKLGRYYSAMPTLLKILVKKKFQRYVAKI